ncbi:MAG: alpha-galactosidase, partial [Acidobacteriota bacterium]|nr:alpha-galactosidase [Acidobacteriota bacterium]
DAEVNQHWIHSTDYPRRKVSASVSGGSQSLQITFMGLRNQPDLVCFFELPAAKRFGILSVALRNVTPHTIDVQDIRVVDALGEPKLNLGGPEQADRVMAESYSEDPTIHIGGLAQAPHGDYYGVKDDLIHNPESKQSLLLAALTSDKFLTISHLRVSMDPGASASISSFTMDSTGTTEAVLTRDPLSSSQTIYLSLPLLPGKSLSSEKILFAAGPSYFQMLEDYGKAVRDMHHARVSSAAPMGWWSWTAFYGGVNEGDILTNAAWLAAHLRLLGYDYFHIDEGYQYARGEYTIANATQFPHGMDSVGHAICRQGLTLGIWTAPFEVSVRAWIYERHKDWLVKDSHGRPIMIGYVHGHTDPLYVLDVTNPAAADYLRDTYRTLTQEWGVRYIKLDFMDSAAIEGRRFRPHTTALEAQRIGLEIIRKAVGDGVLLDKDGSPMLNPVGLVDEGRISVDTGHSFQASKEAAPNIAARFYMNRNFYASDPDAFSVSRQLIPEEHWHQAQKPLTLNEAEVQIVLAAVAGGMYEIGDDLPTLGSEPHRLALVKNQELIDINRLGRAAIPLDLMTFDPEDQQPSVFFLREDRRQAMLAVFNWTETPRSHTFTLASLYLPADHHFEAEDVLNKDAPVAFENGSLTLNDQPPHSVRLIKLIDESMPAMAPAVTANVPSSAAAGSSVQFSADARGSMTPALSYQWDFGDGTSAEGPAVTHTYTSAAIYKVKLSVRGIDGLPALQSFSLTVTGYPNSAFDLKNNRRYKP